MNFYEGAVVRLAETVRRVCEEPKRYQRGVVTEKTGPWGVCRVQWNGVDHPICMRSDEIELIKEEQ